ncbi:related to S. pombe trp-asp repeat containing protein, partial [Serendipita indica DSM 11827]
MERMFEANQNKAGHQASSGPQDSLTSVPSSICEPSMMAGGPTTNVGEDYARQMIPNVDMDPFRKRYHVAVDKVMEIGVLVEELRGDVQEVVASNLHRGNDSIDESIIRLSYGTDLEICESGTRVEILTRIRNWADDANHSQQIFWLSDAAGTGKSTVATTIAKEWQGQGRLGGRFFFNPNVALDQDIRHFCRIVAYDIVSNHPQLATSINLILIASPEDTMDFAMQFVRLILDPLQSLSSTTSIFLVIDALDNCEFKSRQRLLNVVLKELRTAPRIKLLLTSRPIPDIGDRLSDPVYICEGHLLDINNRSHEDIARYVRANLDQQLDIKEQERI